MTNGTITLSKNTSVFIPVSQVNYEYYPSFEELKILKENSDIQCTIGYNLIPFGLAQQPSLTQYADKIDTIKFLLSL
jgi:hypothetical protein